MGHGKVGRGEENEEDGLYKIRLIFLRDVAGSKGKVTWGERSMGSSVTNW